MERLRLTSRLCWCLSRYPFYCVCIQVGAVINVAPVFMLRYEFGIVALVFVAGSSVYGLGCEYSWT